MNTMTPTDTQRPALRRLWKAAFGDTDGFLDDFYATAYAPERCRCVEEDGKIVSVLYWFDCELEGAKLAYVYAVATDPVCRGRGLCRMLMEDTARHLKALGCRGIVLVPQEPGLIRMYAGMGYTPCGSVDEFHVTAGEAVPLRRIGAAEYAQRRRRLLPAGGVIQEGENLRFLATQASFYAGENWLAATAEVDGMLWCPELLGDAGAAAGLVKALGYREGSFRVPGNGRPFAMFRPLVVDCPVPRYFGLAFD
ncbi:MAG: GNAT family N-acetyltransferase [Oscillospiraceae bacterium]|nr:GNAT family N-acetyltransferase [Oscillospiraceae bacterium]